MEMETFLMIEDLFQESALTLGSHWWKNPMMNYKQAQ